MKELFLTLISLLSLKIATAQKTSSNLIEGGKTLVELISVLKKNKTAGTANLSGKNVVDSCAAKQTADLCFKNSSSKDLAISIYKRTDAGYEAQPFTMKVITKKQECWYELHSGIYKYKIEIDTGGTKTLMSEGELRLQQCDNMQREVTE